MIAEVEPCRDAQEVVLPGKIKASAVLLKAIVPVSVFVENMDTETFLDAIRARSLLAYVQPAKQTLELCMAAVEQTGRALAYCRPELQTLELCATKVRRYSGFVPI